MLGTLGKLVKMGEAQRVVMSLPSPMASGVLVASGGLLCYLGLLGLSAAGSNGRVVSIFTEALVQTAKETATAAS